LAFTAFALEPGRDHSEVFDFQPFEEASAVIDRRYPERAIGHQRPAIEAAAADAGLRIESLLRGAWAPPQEYDGGQDLFVAVRP
jgi:hypothetical protein